LHNLLRNYHESIYASKYFLVKGFCSSPQIIPFYTITYTEGPKIENDSFHMVGLSTSKLFSHYVSIVNAMDMREGFANRHH